MDVLLIGPFDLGNNIGHPFLGEVPEALKEAIAKIRKAGAAAGKKMAIYCTGGEQAKMYADQGFDMLSVINDMSAIPNAMTASLKAAKGGEDTMPVRKVGGYS